MRLVPLLAALVAAACAGATMNAPDQPAGPALLPVAADVRTAPATATLAARALRLEGAAWRDFMPISPPEGKPLVVTARILAADGGVLPAGLVAEALWTVRGDRAWRVAGDEQRRDGDGRTLEVVARGGPSWPTGERVDVVVAVRVAGERVLLRAQGVTIERTM